MVAEAQRAPRVVRKPFVAFATHPVLSANPPSAFRRLLIAIEPWYDWGRTNVFRLDARCPRFSDEAEGEVRFFEVQWLGLHFEVRFGRTPKAVQ